MSAIDSPRQVALPIDAPYLNILKQAMTGFVPLTQIVHSPLNRSMLKSTFLSDRLPQSRRIDEKRSLRHVRSFRGVFAIRNSAQVPAKQ